MIEKDKVKYEAQFKAWFKDQFGPRPSPHSLLTLELKVVELERKATEARYLYNQVRIYDNWSSAALFAWDAARDLLLIENNPEAREGR
jgi:hypothetical protein